jgi:hypothetical protein
MFADALPSTVSSWINLLSISTQFSFSRLRQRAILELNADFDMDPVEKIVLAEKFHLSEWKKPAFMDLVQRDLFHYEEAVKLGPKTSHALYMAREEARRITVFDEGSLAGRSPHPAPSGSYSNVSSGTLHVSAIVDRIFFDITDQRKIMGENVAKNKIAENEEVGKKLDQAEEKSVNDNEGHADLDLDYYTYGL